MERQPQSVNLTDRIEWWWYLLGAGLPIVGAIAGIVFMGRSKIGPAIALWATSLLAVLVWSGIFTLVEYSSAFDDASTNTAESVSVGPAAQKEDTAVATAPAANIRQPEGFQDCGNGVYAADKTTTCPFALDVYKSFKKETAESVPAVVELNAYSEALGRTVYVACEYPENEVTCQGTRGAEIRFAVPF
jgi:hypothetical protein